MSLLQQPPHRFTGDISWEDAKPLLNDNLEKIVSSTNDIGARFSSTSGTSSWYLSGGNAHAFQVNVTDTRPEAVPGSLPVTPRIKTFVDNDADDNYLLGVGGSLSAGQQLVLQMTTTFRGYFSGTNNVAAFIVQFYNGDVSPHYVYFTVDEFYMNSPAEGYFR